MSIEPEPTNGSEPSRVVVAFDIQAHSLNQHPAVFENSRKGRETKAGDSEVAARFCGSCDV